MGKYDETRSIRGKEADEVERSFRKLTEPATKSKSAGKAAAKTSAKMNAEQKKRLTIIIAGAGTLVLLLGIIIGILVFSGNNADDGRILKNVCAAGVNLGGLTMDEAKSALRLATDKTFSKVDMVVTLPDSSFTISPQDSGAALDVDAVAQAAYDYGRTGTDAENEQAKKNAATRIHTIALLPYLNLDLPAIQTTIRNFCNSYSSTMTQPTFELIGERPEYDPENPNKVVTHQTLTINMGTPDYALSSDELYNRVLDAYSLNEMQVTYEAPPLTKPDVPNAEALFTQYCLAPVDAVMDPVTFEVTPEVYGYGFDVEKVQEQIDKAYYGDEVVVTFEFIMPYITAKDLSENLFLDTLASCTVKNTDGNSTGRNNNLKLSCEAINGIVIKAGDVFSFNDVVGRLTAEKGYKKAPMMVDGEQTDVLGGGVSQTASALYYCALMADLDIVERYSHDFAVSFIDLGLDAAISWGAKDLSFRNNTGAPLRIVAKAEGSEVSIELVGTDELEYEVEITFEIVKEKKPLTVFQTMDKNNVLGYKEGDVLQKGIAGCDVETYMSKLDKETGELIVRTLVDISNYSKRDEIVVKIENRPLPTEPTEPEETTEPTEPEETTQPEETTEPTEPEETTQPEETTEPEETVESQESGLDAQAA